MAQGIQDTNLQIAIGKLPQTNYATPTALTTTPKNYIEQIVTAKNLIKKQVPTVNNKGQSTGQRFATESWAQGKHETMYSMPFDCSFQNIGRHLLAAMGAVTVSASAALFQHRFKMLDTKISAQLPAYSIIEQAAPGILGINGRGSGFCAKSLKLSGDGVARCKGQTEWIGAGDYTNPSGATWATHVDSVQGTQTPIYNTIAAFSAREDTSFYEPDYSLCENLGWEININNTFAEDDYGCVRLFDANDVAKGVLRSHLLLVDTEISAKFKFKLPLDSKEMQVLENQIPFSVSLILLSTATETATSQKLWFTLPINKFKMLDRTSENGFFYCTIEPEILYSLTESAAMEVRVTNNITSYI